MAHMRHTIEPFYIEPLFVSRPGSWSGVTPADKKTPKTKLSAGDWALYDLMIVE